MDAARAVPGFGDVCKVMTVSLQRNGCFHWGEIRGALGEEAYAGMQRWRDPERVWVVRHGSAGPAGRSTILDHSTVLDAEGHGGSPGRHAVLYAPSAARPGEPTCVAIGMKSAIHEHWHRIGPNVTDAAHPGLVEEIVRSFQDAMALNVEEEACRMMSTMEEDLALVDYDEYAASDGEQERRVLGMAGIAGAGARIARTFPGVAFPRGIVAMVSPEQAAQLCRDDAGGPWEGRAGGIDIVASPAIKYDDERGGYAAIVAAKGSIYVSLGPMEIHAEREKDGGIGVVARYVMSVALKPKKVARVFSYRR